MSAESLKYLGIFFLIASAQGLFFVVSQVSQPKRFNKPRIFLSAIIFLFSVSLIESGLWWTEKMSDFPHFIMVSDPPAFLYGPLVYFYFKSSFSRFAWQKKDLLHILPFVLSFIYCSQFYFHASGTKEAMLNGELPFRGFFSYYAGSLPTFILKSISLSVYAGRVFYEFSEKTVLREVRSWFRLSIGVFTFYIFFFVLFHILEFTDVITGCADYGIGVASGLFIYLFSWFGLVRPRVFDGYTLQESLKPVLGNKDLQPDPRDAEILEQIQQLMTGEKLYRDEDIRLETLARKIGLPRHVVSQVINSTGMSFFEYINHWRIEEAKKILAGTSKKEFNIIEVAYEVGFANKVSFNRFFKKSTGLTPTEYRKLSITDRQEKIA